jgi:hypothetical protein
VGYRAWAVDEKDQLWPLWSKRRPWLPGVNTARCNCRVTNSLKFDWSWQDGQRVLEPSPSHAAPQPECVCGLYSWRRPPQEWFRRPELSAPPSVIGAVASWGRMQVHDTGFRAEHACVVTIAYDEAIGREPRERLERIAHRYRVELVPLGELEEAASVHGTPLPDTLRPPADEPAPDAAVPADAQTPPEAGQGLDEEDQAAVARVTAWARRTPVGPLVGNQRRIGLRWRALFLTFECAVTIAFALLAARTYDSQARSELVQKHGFRVNGRVVSRNIYGGCIPRSAVGCYATEIIVKFTRPAGRARTIAVGYPRNVPVRRGQQVQLALDPHDPSYAELIGQPRSSSGIWVVAVVLAALAAAVTLLDARRVLRLSRHGRQANRGTR